MGTLTPNRAVLGNVAPFAGLQLGHTTAAALDATTSRGRVVLEMFVKKIDNVCMPPFAGLHVPRKLDEGTPPGGAGREYLHGVGTPLQ